MPANPSSIIAHVEGSGAAGPTKLTVTYPLPKFPSPTETNSAIDWAK
jgi:hypothetical protein